MKLSLENIQLSEKDEITVDAEFSFDDSNSDSIKFRKLSARDLDTALSGVLRSFSESLDYNEYRLRSDVGCILRAKNSDGFNKLLLEFVFENGNAKTCVEWTGTLLEISGVLYDKIIGALIDFDRFDLCEPWASNSRQLPEGAPLSVGDYVRTITGGNVKTERTGYIYSRSFHHKQNKHLYYLLIDGKRYKKQYYENELERINA